MSKTVLYEGYAILSSPRYVAESDKWQLCIVISIRPHGWVKPREFSSEVLYPTEQEADIHEIDFGQRLIDGKVEGRSVSNMKMENRRATPRFYGQFHTTVSGPTKTEGTGIMLDLSAGGCQLESPLTIARGQLLELRISVPGLESPLMIDGARVQWVSGQFVGLAFVRIRKTEQQRLDRVIADLRVRGDEEDAH
ncbi:MAG: PilZ domain-containing protein [Nitrospirota bacterium]